jgi:formylglycine-generating enzyme required for sulfatase activity
MDRLSIFRRKAAMNLMVSVIVAFLMLFTAYGGEDGSVSEGEIDSLVGEMVNVKGGTFTMGCTSEQGNDCLNAEKPAHQVTLSDFQIGKYEVTQVQWTAMMGDNPSSFKGENLPVENVSWDDVQEFIRKLNEMTGGNYRLPTEAEWEYAARGGSQSRGYKYSGSNDAGDVAWFRDNSERMTHPVGTKKANELGIHDMSGNVFEWVNDWFGNYGGGVQIPQGASLGSGRVIRGGGWLIDARPARVSARYGLDPGRRDLSGLPRRPQFKIGRAEPVDV